MTWKSEERTSTSKINTISDKVTGLLNTSLGTKLRKFPKYFEFPTVCETMESLVDHRASTIKNEIKTEVMDAYNERGLTVLIRGLINRENVHQTKEIRKLRDRVKRLPTQQITELQAEILKLKEDLRVETSNRISISREVFFLTERLEKAESFTMAASRSLKTQFNELNAKMEHPSKVKMEEEDQDWKAIWSAMEKLTKQQDLNSKVITALHLFRTRL